MKLWKISQSTNCGWDTYDSAVVAAETKTEARVMHPHSGTDIHTYKYTAGDWVVSPKLVTIEYLGVAKQGIEKSVIVASFNAG